MSYLLHNPDAQDTLEGIAQWWLLERCLEPRLVEIRQAVEDLTEQGLLVARGGHGQPQRFQIHRDRLAEIRRVLGS